MDFFLASNGGAGTPLALFPGDVRSTADEDLPGVIDHHLFLRQFQQLFPNRIAAHKPTFRHVRWVWPSLSQGPAPACLVN